MDEPRKVAYQFLVEEELDEAIIEGRREQPDLPTKTEAVRRLLKQALGYEDSYSLIEEVEEVDLVTEWTAPRFDRTGSVAR
jgi:hypothetical protein